MNNNKTNKQILNEAFFKKPSYSEKVASKMPQYKPVGSSKELGSQLDMTLGNAVPVLSTDEVKRRLTTGFGVSFGNNNVRSMATKALKTFPIVVSDNLEPETVVMLKKLMEDQYAEYISLLISNKVVDLSNYETGDESGNIAIQALDSISGSDFSSTRVANKAANTGKISADDVFANIPLYNLLRENQMVLNSGDILIDTLLENALEVPSEDAQRVVDFIQENANVLVEYKTEDYKDPSNRDRSNKKEYKEKANYSMRSYLKGPDYEKATDNIVKHDIAKDVLRGFAGLDPDGKEIYTKLTNAEVVVNRDQLQTALNRSVGEMLTLPENAPIRDRFEKATYLLHMGRIAGKEYIDYVTLRLGIPVSKETRRTLIVNNRIKDIQHSSGYVGAIRTSEITNIQKNQRIDAAVKSIYRQKVGSIVASGVGAGIGGAAIGGGIASIVGATLLWPAIVGGAVVGSIAGLTAILTKLGKGTKLRNPKIEGWERVEALINTLDRQRAGVLQNVTTVQGEIRNANTNFERDRITAGNKLSIDASAKDYHNLVGKEIAPADLLDKSFNGFRKSMSVLTESNNIDYTVYTEDTYVNEEMYNLAVETMDEIFTEMANDPEVRAMYNEAKLLSLEEKSLETSMPVNIKYVEKNPDKNVLITPSFMARSNYGYGSTEIERRENRDRRYNQPLIMTVKFKERFSDGKYSDNELTAVIGILGKIIRVPSEEMKYILKSNAEGDVLKGFLSGDIENTVTDLLKGSKISKDVKNLPQSVDMWKNLEKVATLATTNAMTGKRSGNIANAHIVFSQKEVDEVRSEEGIDYLRDMKNVAKLMKKYSAFTLMVANDAGQRVYIYDDLDDISWNVVPYSALMGKDSGDQLTAALAKLGRI